MSADILAPSRYVVKAAGPDGPVVVFDASCQPPRSVAVCLSSPDAYEVRAGLELLAQSTAIVQGVYGVPV